MDEIRIQDLQVYAHHGVFPEENEKGQNFFVNATLYLDTGVAGIQDDLEQSVSYADVCMFIDAYMKEHTYKLLEAVAEHMTRDLLLKFPLLRKVSMEIRKPEAPIPLPFGSVSVCIQRGWKRAFIALGSNMGDKEKYLKDAIAAVKKHQDCKVIKVSDFKRTTPYGVTNQEEFLNGAMEIETLLSPMALLDFMQELEQEANRVREYRWGPRTLDLDLLFFEDEVIHNDRLTVPHIDMQNRDFVIGPMAEIAPYYIHPIFHMSMIQMYQELQATKEQHIIQ